MKSKSSPPFQKGAHPPLLNPFGDRKEVPPPLLTSAPLCSKREDTPNSLVVLPLPFSSRKSLLMIPLRNTQQGKAEEPQTPGRALFSANATTVEKGRLKARFPPRLPRLFSLLMISVFPKNQWRGNTAGHRREWSFFPWLSVHSRDNMVK